MKEIIVAGCQFLVTPMDVEGNIAKAFDVPGEGSPGPQGRPGGFPGNDNDGVHSHFQSE
jgi:hypothetical protein